ncbi:MAG: SDR family oxidoreductase [Ahniella sp.]|nr:SDR family oxidoreductase [Ahniella sp.]
MSPRPIAGGREPHLAVAADIASVEGRALIRDAVAKLGEPLFALIHAAGISRFSLLSDTPSGDVEAQMTVNAVAPILLTQRLLPLLDPKGARILTIGSSFGTIGYPGFSAYCASKFALRGFTEALRRELGDSQIQVAHLAPRATQTSINSAAVCAMNQELGNTMDPPEVVAAQVERMLRARRMNNRAIGWPERLFLRINALVPALVDGALRKQLPAIKRFAAVRPHP